MRPCLSEEDHVGNIQIDEHINSTQTIQTKEDNNGSINKLLDIDLYVIGRIWINAVQTALTGKNVKLIPAVLAAKEPQVPQKPPKMKYTDLPLYQSPHNDYKMYMEDSNTCADRNVKILHNCLLPYVKSYRRMVTKNLCEMKCIAFKNGVCACEAAGRAKDEFKNIMRHPDNVTERRALVGAGTLTGYLLGASAGIPRRIFFAGVGFFGAGALCFPRETDEMFRSLAYAAGKAAVAFHNAAFDKDIGLREKISCEDEPPSPRMTSVQCPSKK